MFGGIIVFFFFEFFVIYGIFKYIEFFRIFLRIVFFRIYRKGMKFIFFSGKKSVFKFLKEFFLLEVK